MKSIFQSSINLWTFSTGTTISRPGIKLLALVRVELSYHSQNKLDLSTCIILTPYLSAWLMEKRLKQQLESVVSSGTGQWTTLSGSSSNPWITLIKYYEYNKGAIPLFN
ncbi:hypothetical protein AMECASPLE_034150 [Ameca splendens]|uniref:Uncharacterized protein n=1 Tax=Ameca splendens TaxID=208324 RepID=A0ABV0YJ16_9TELE